MSYSLHKRRLCRAAEFTCAARGYWLGVFPRVLAEVRRWRTLAERVPDPVLRAAALGALARKRGNLEGAAAFATLVERRRRPLVIRTLVAAQATCDYLDFLCEQPNRDPIANGRALHRALLDAVNGGFAGNDYYRHHLHHEDGGYLHALVRTIAESLAALPARSRIGDSLSIAAGRIASYQAFNHGDAVGSYAPFEQWAEREGKACPHLSWWEAGAAAGSTLSLHVLLAAAADPRLGCAETAAIERTYFPWIGALHSLLDSLVDRGEDLAYGMCGLIDFYESPAHAAARMRLIAGEAIQHAQALPRGGRHRLILTAMASFYLCQLHRPDSCSITAAVVPAVRDTLGAEADPAIAVLRARRALRGEHRDSLALPALSGVRGASGLESRKSST